MGSVCASSLSLMHAGVPLAAPVAGIAMGLIYENGNYATLTDILGAEDAFGDMDFKVAGTSEFVTALQLDTKLNGIPSDVLGKALQQARDARLFILGIMAEAIDGPQEMSPYAPRIITIKIPVDQIGAVIGPKGKMINQIQDETGADITIEDDGTIYVGATDGEKAQAAIEQIQAITNPVMPEVGERFMGTVVKTAAFGAFVSLVPGKDGLLHVSQVRKIAGGARVENVEDILKVGDKVEVELAEIDSRGKFSLIPVVDGVALKDEPKSDRGPREGGGDRGPREGGGDRDRGPRGGGDRDRGPREDRGPRTEGDRPPREGGDRAPRERVRRRGSEGDGAATAPAFSDNSGDSAPSA
jgi:polyribonucleotide nucleotidyltransferase